MRPSQDRIYTIGHGGRTVDELLEQLLEHGIKFLLDVRSVPYSKYQPEFNRERLEVKVEATGMRYGFMGQQLGGRPKDSGYPTFYDENRRVVYERVRETSFFKQGIERLQDACAQGFVVCLLCAESNPAMCHRSSMIGPALDQVGIELIHLLKGGGTKSQQAIMLQKTGGQRELFPGFAGGPTGQSTRPVPQR